MNLVTERVLRRPVYYGALLRLQLLTLLAQHSLAAELDLIAFQRQDLDQYLVAFLQLITHLLDAVLRDLADVQQTIRAREDLDEGSEIDEPDHLAQISL